MWLEGDFYFLLFNFCFSKEIWNICYVHKFSKPLFHMLPPFKEKRSVNLLAFAEFLSSLSIGIVVIHEILYVHLLNL